MPFTVVLSLFLPASSTSKRQKNKGICEITEGVFSEVYSQTDLHVSSGAPNYDFLQNTFKTVLRLS